MTMDASRHWRRNVCLLEELCFAAPISGDSQAPNSCVFFDRGSIAPAKSRKARCHPILRESSISNHSGSSSERFQSQVPIEDDFLEAQTGSSGQNRNPSAFRITSGSGGPRRQLVTYPSRQSPDLFPDRSAAAIRRLAGNLYQAFSQPPGPRRLWISLGALFVANSKAPK